MDWPFELAELIISSHVTYIPSPNNLFLPIDYSAQNYEPTLSISPDQGMRWTFLQFGGEETVVIY